MAEYTDYKTNKKISREQYIANGLERGECLIKEDCGCIVIQDRTAGAYIVGCYKHEAAPDMYEELEQVRAMFARVEAVRELKGYEKARYERVKQALSKAEGGAE